jgi:FdhE protein
MKPSKWDRRLQRADELAETHPYAAEVLGFYRSVTVLQKDLYAYFEQTWISGPAGTLPSAPVRNLDVSLLTAKFRKFVSEIEKVAPQPVAASAAALCTGSDGRCQELLSCCWQDVADVASSYTDSERMLASTFLQAFSEYLADRSQVSSQNWTLAICPFCACRPTVGVLRPEGDGAKRSLICSLCSTEWAYGRIICPSCGEEAAEKLAVYSTEQFRHVRIEACDSCKHYIKTVDLTRNGHAVPVVDELATIPLNLWAQEHGYTKIHTNLMGL